MDWSSWIWFHHRETWLKRNTHIWEMLRQNWCRGCRPNDFGQRAWPILEYLESWILPDVEVVHRGSWIQRLLLVHQARMTEPKTSRVSSQKSLVAGMSQSLLTSSIQPNLSAHSYHPVGNPILAFVSIQFCGRMWTTYERQLLPQVSCWPPRFQFQRQNSIGNSCRQLYVRDFGSHHGRRCPRCPVLLRGPQICILDNC